MRKCNKKAGVGREVFPAAVSRSYREQEVEPLESLITNI